MLTKSLLVWMLHFASEYSGYPVPDELPVIEFVRPSVIIEQTGNSEALAYVELYGPNAGTIYVPTLCYPMSTRRCQGYLIHEITHYLQFKHGQFHGQTCLGPWEKEAYFVEEKFHNMHNETLADYDVPPAYLAEITACPAPYEDNTMLSNEVTK